MNMDQDSRRLVMKVITDVVCLLLVGFPILIFYVAGRPYERGFFCNDESLKHPYLDSTVPSWTLYVFGLGLPIAAIIGIEFVIFKYFSEQRQRTILNKTIPNWMWESYRHIGVFGFGAACSQLTTDVAKYTIGRLRPHFFSVCQPDIDCRLLTNQNVYIERFHCRGGNPKLLKDMRLSFPSGHSSFSTYCALFLVAYIHAKMKWRGSKLLKHVIQYLAIVLALYVCLTRISDYKHHWSDVLVGVLQGAIVAVLIVRYVSDLFPNRISQLEVAESCVDETNNRPENGSHAVPPPPIEEKQDNHHNIVI